MVPVVTLLVLDLVPERRGMASSLQAFVGSTANGVVAGVISPGHALCPWAGHSVFADDVHWADIMDVPAPPLA